MASAGLEGPHWAAEFPSADAAASEAQADLADEAAEVSTPAAVDAATAQAAAAQPVFNMSKAKGLIRFTGTMAELKANDAVRSQYLSV